MVVDPIARQLERHIRNTVTYAAQPDDLLQYLMAAMVGISVSVLGPERATDLLALSLYACQQTAAKAAKAAQRKRKRKSARRPAATFPLETS